MNRVTRHDSWLAAALVPLLAACAPPAAAPRPVDLLQFEASAPVVAAGGSVTLTWEAAGDVASVEVFRGAESLGQSTEAAGTLVATNQPAGKATYELLVTGTAQDYVRRQVEVEGVTVPTIVEFRTDRSAVAAGGAVVLTWTTALAGTVVITSDSGVTVGQRTGEEARTGALVVRPEATTEYTLVATGIGGAQREKVRVTVLARPAFTSLEASPGRLLAGQPTTLSWATTNATELVVKVGGRTVFTAAPAVVASGTRSFELDQSTVLTTVLTGPGGTLSADRTVTVVPAARVTQFWSEPPDVILGGDATLRWVAVGIGGVTLKANGVDVDLGEHTGASGSFRIEPTTTTLYELDGSGEGGEAHAELLVNVYGTPVIDGFDSDRAVVFRNREPATLSWTTQNGTVLSIADDFGNLVDTSTQAVAAGAVTVTPNETTNYTLTLVGPGGTAQRQLPAPITVDDPLPLVTLSLGRSQVILGETTELSWTIEDHTSFTIEALTEGEAEPVLLDTSGKSAQDVLSLPTPTDTTHYTLRAYGARAELVTIETRTLSVVKLPAFTTFTSDKLVTDENGSRVVVTSGQEYTISWATTDATSVEFDVPFASIEGKADTQAVAAPSSWDADSYATSIAFPAGFSFPFHGARYSSVQMATDGYLCFGGSVHCTSSSTYTNQNLPSASLPNNLIAPFWDDLEWDTGSSFLWRIDGAAPNRTMTFEWNDFEFYDGSSDGNDLVFQVVLTETGEWSIRNAPRAMPASTDPSVIGSSRRWGSQATIGAEGPDGTGAVNISFDDPTASALCHSFTPGSTTSGTFGTCVAKISPDDQQNQLPTTGSLTLVAGNPGNLFLKMKAVGPVGSTVSPDLLVRVVPAARAAEFTVSRVPTAAGARPTSAHIGAGEAVNLFYAVGPSASVVREHGISNGTADETGVANMTGFITVAPAATTTYTLYAVNEAGDRDEKSVTVVVGAPTAAAFSASALPRPADGSDRTSAPVGDTFEFRWQSSGARRLWIESPSGAVVLEPLSWDVPGEQARITEGTFQTPLSEPGVYQLKVANGPAGAESVTTRDLTLDIITTLEIVQFSSSLPRQTEGRNIVLSWQTFNANAISLSSCQLTTATACDDEAARLELPDMPLTANVRLGNWSAPVGAATTRFFLRARGSDGTWSAPATVDVESVLAARVTRFSATRPVISWNEQTTLEWTVENARSVQLFALNGTAANAAVAYEITEAAGQLPTGSVTLTLVKSAGYRVVATNELGTETTRDLDPAVTVNVSVPTLSFTATPDGNLPAGGMVQLRWSATQSENVYLWQREPETAEQGAAIAAANGEPERVEAVNVPYDFVPYDFVDISETGAALDFKEAATTSLATDLSSGRAFVDLPADFNPHFFGENAGRVMVTTEGALFLAPDTAAQAESDFDTTCRTGRCTRQRVTASTTEDPRAGIYPFWAALSACQGWTTADPECDAEGRVPGRAFWELRGAAPNRVLIVQWDRWDASAAANQGTFTFEAKLFENGDVEFQYKVLESARPTFARGDNAVVGVDRRFYKGSPINYFLAIGNEVPILNVGDGYRIYSGRRPASGTVRSFYPRAVTEGGATKLPFRAIVNNSRETENRKTVRIAPVRVPGQNDVFINELMVDPVPGDDVGQEWIELRNTSAAPADLTNFQIQTSSGSFLLPGGTIPADGFTVLGQNLVTAQNGGVPVDLAYGNQVVLDDTVDSVILRYGNILIDRVEYDAHAAWTLPAGRSMAVDLFRPSSHLQNDSPEVWCASHSPTESTVRATPGQPNFSCFYDPTTDLSTDATAQLVSFVATSGEDRISPAFDIGFPFPFFGFTAAQLAACENGWLALAPSSGTAHSNSALPSTSIPANAIAPFWNDLQQGSQGRILTKLFGTAPHRYRVVQWKDYSNLGTTSTLDFRVVLRESGRFEVHFGPMSGTNALGESATTGYQAANGQFVNFGVNSSYLPAGGLHGIRWP